MTEREGLTGQPEALEQGRRSQKVLAERVRLRSWLAGNARKGKRCEWRTTT